MWLLVTALWLLSLKLKTVSFVDSFWGVGFGVLAWASLAQTGATTMGLIVAGLTTLWSLRLGTHLLRRFLDEGEDARYAAMRDKAGPSWPLRSYVVVFLLQGTLMWMVALPVQVTIAAPPEAWPDALTVGGILVFLFGFVFEAIADQQLNSFRRRNTDPDAIMDKGLWCWSRHPNYFGNACLWWGLFLIAASAGHYWTIIGPLIMTFLLLRVSGVTLLEAHMEATRPAYAAYKNRTSPFLPLPPKS